MKTVLKGFTLFFLVISYFAFASVSDVSAQTTITIETNDPGINADNLCSLREAVENANSNSQPHTDCPAGSAIRLTSTGKL